MAKKSSMRCDWSGSDWFWGAVSEAAGYAFIYYTLMVLGASGNLWVTALILWVLANVGTFACPIVRKHYL